MSYYRLRAVNIGAEGGTPGTPVAATTRLRVPATWLNDARTVVRANDATGVFLPTPRTYTPNLYASIPVEGDVTFEQLGYILNGGIKGVAGVKDGAGSGYVSTYPFPVSGANTLYYYTLEGVNQQQSFEMEYGFVEEFELSWKAPTQGSSDGAWQFKATWGGRQATKCTATTLATPTGLETVLSPKLYIDAVTGIGGTVKVSCFRGFTFRWRRNIPVWTGDGMQYFTRVDLDLNPESPPELDIVLDWDAVGEDQYDAWTASTQKGLRIKSEGSALSAGTVYSKKTLFLDFYGTQVGNPKESNQNGADLMTYTYQMGEADTSGAGVWSNGQIVLVNALAALP
ncbi:MAG: hypothetical protein WC869_10365 [Phycisphaerae bacterium]|jgi:hypothetical protein